MNLSKQLNQPVLKKHSLIAILGIALGITVYYYFAFADSISENTINDPIILLFFILTGIITSYATYFISRTLDHSLSWQKQLTNRFLAGILSTFIASLTIMAAGIYLYAFVFSYSTIRDQSSLILKLSIILFLVMLLYNIIYFALYSYHVYSKLQIEAITYDRKQIGLQLKALKSQLSAHFLFNNLNTISSLAHKDVELCNEYTRGLAAIYNYTLHSYDHKWVSFKEEFKIASAYLSLLQTRFGNALDYQINIPEPVLTSKIPPLTLQMLIENAVKHNQIDIDNKLKIHIEADNGYIKVKNNITNTPAKVKSFQIGLKNISARYHLLTNRDIKIMKDTHFTVTFPVIN